MNPNNVPRLNATNAPANAAQMGGRRRRTARKTRRASSGKTPAVGSRAAVYHGNADHTSGGLKKGDLVMNKHGRIVSRRKMALGKKAIKTLYKAGYKPKKGTFKLFKK